MKRSLIALVALLAIAAIITLSIYTPPSTAGGNVASANGSGHAGSLSLSFGAFDHGDGNFTGQATFIDDAKKTKVSIEVECLSVNSNMATVGGTVKKSTNPNFAPNTPVSFFVVDNGEGEGALPDAFSSPFLGGCGAPQSAVPVPMESDAGNIQVRFVAPDKECSKCPFGTHCAGNGECVGGGGGGGGGGGACKAGFYDCCGTCIPDNQACGGCPPAGK